MKPRFVSEDERVKILHEFNDTKVDYGRENNVLKAFRAQAENKPTAEAVKYGDISLTYRELDQLSSKFADYLGKKHQVEAEDMVGMKLDRSHMILVVILGILKTGSAYVPIDTSNPEERVELIKRDSGCKICVDQPVVDEFLNSTDKYSDQALTTELAADQAAYAIYTSGSTGIPKGVVNTHAGLYNRLKWMMDDLNISNDDIVLQKTPYSFDVSVWELLILTIAGSRVVFAKPDGHKDPIYLQKEIEENGITIMHFVPSMLSAFLEEIDEVKCSSLKHVICSGEALPSPMVVKFKEKLNHVRIHNYYGPTEAAIDVTAIDLTDVNTAAQGVSIGKPVANTTIYIVDEYMALSPVGIPGELLIGGDQVSRGYLNRPELNVEKFVNSPFKQGEKLYRSGDLARWMPNGQIEYINRIDNQVKIRGNRVELGEVEAVMLDSSLVKNAVALVKDIENLGARLVGYVVEEEGYSEDNLLAYMRQRVPEYMVPNFLMVMETFPLTSSGKVNRKLFPDPKVQNTYSYVAPRDEMEEKLAGIWTKVLGIEKVGVHDNFFRIGGDSISSIKLISLIDKTLKIKLEIGQVYEANTIEGLGLLIRSDINKSEGYIAKKEEIASQISELKGTVLEEYSSPELIDDVYPMSDIQKGMVMLSLMNPSAAMYHDQFMFHMPKVDIHIFHKALEKLVEKHAALRTWFDLESYEKEVQLVGKNISFDIHTTDLTHLDKKEQEEHIKAYMTEERNKPFEVQATPPWRASVFYLNGTLDMFLFQFHHAILDGWSIASLNTELYDTYRKLILKNSFQPVPLKSSVKDAIVESLYERQNQENIQFWKEELEDYKRLDIFTGELHSEFYSSKYDLEFRDQLEAKCYAENTSLKSVMYAAFVYVMKVLSYEDDFVVGMVSNNRPLVEDGDKVLGCFLNSVPVRNEVSNYKTATWDNFFNGIETKLVNLKKHDRLTLYEIARINNEIVSQSSPFFDVLYNYTDFHVHNDVFNNKSKTGSEQTNNRLDLKIYESTNTLLDFDVNVSNGGLTLSYTLKRKLKYNVSLERIHNYVYLILGKFINNGQDVIVESQLINETEKNTIISKFNEPAVELAVDVSILDLINKQVVSTPELVAIADDRVELTYQQLGVDTDRLAHYLAAKYAVGKGDFVAIEMTRSAQTIMVMLAVLKTGAAYVPIDKDYPQQRKAYIYTDCKCNLIINEEFMAEFASNAPEGDDRLPVEVRLTDHAYIIYTSGSTGTPKGVVINHSSLADYALTFRDFFELTTADSIVQQSSISFDTSVEEIYPMLITGGKVIVHSNKGDFDDLFKVCEEQGVTVLSTNPFVLDYMNEVYDEFDFKFRSLISGGDILKPAYIDNIFGKTKIYNTYGPTESTVCATYHHITSLENTIPIGKPSPNRIIYIMQPGTTQLTPIGMVGEICIGGTGLAEKYLNDAGLTAERFTENPFGQNERLYHTGDLGMWLDDGSVEFMGREDNQVSIRGYRIETGELERAILETEYAENAHVMIKDDEHHGPYLVAYLIPANDYSPNSLKEELLKVLPHYMIPSRFVAMEKFPLTSNGKLDRNALLTSSNEGETADNYKTPKSNTEKRLASIWENLLGVEEVGTLDNFFSVGGNSLSAVRLRRIIEKEFGKQLNIVDLFNHTTIAAISELLNDGEKVKNDEEALNIIEF